MKQDEVTIAANNKRTRVVKTNTKDENLIRQRRDHLIAAAIKVFIQKGFHEATVRDIGREANMTQGTIYNYVSSKDDILYLVCDQIISEYQDKVRKSLETSSEPVNKIRNALRAVASVVYDHEDEILLIYHYSHLLDSRSRQVILARVDEFIHMFEVIITSATNEAGVEVSNIQIAANILTYLPTIIAMRRWALKGRTSQAEVVEFLSNFMARGLGFN